MAPSKEERNLIAYDEDYIVQLASHNYEDFSNMVLSKSNSSTVVWLIYASKWLKSLTFIQTGASTVRNSSLSTRSSQATFTSTAI